MTFDGALAYLNAKHESKMRFGLGRMRAFLAKLGDPQESFKSIHVAGTNGKGSTCYMLESTLRANGYKTGLYTSPHLFDVCERIRVAGKDIGHGDFARLGSRLREVQGHDGLTYFEFLTAMAFVYFKEQKVDLVILETGLGGRLDATNVIKRPQLSIVTTIGYDHTDWLGKTLEKIAGEKAGIFKKGCPALIGRMPQTAKKVFIEHARSIGCPLLILRPMTYGHGPQNDSNLVSLNGKHQIDNAHLVFDALTVLQQQGFKMNRKATRTGFKNAESPGRWDIRMIDGKPWVFDVAHNPQAVAAFMSTLKASRWAKTRPRWAIIGFFADKDYPAMINKIAPYFDRLIATPLLSPRSCTLEQILKHAPVRKTQAAATVEEAVGICARSKESRFIATLGSFRLVAPALENIDN